MLQKKKTVVLRRRSSENPTNCESVWGEQGPEEKRILDLSARTIYNRKEIAEKVNWKLLKTEKLTFRALALRQSKRK